MFRSAEDWDNLLRQHSCLRKLSPLKKRLPNIGHEPIIDINGLRVFSVLQLSAHSTAYAKRKRKRFCLYKLHFCQKSGMLSIHSLTYSLRWAYKCLAFTEKNLVLFSPCWVAACSVSRLRVYSKNVAQMSWKIQCENFLFWYFFRFFFYFMTRRVSLNLFELNIS